MTPDGPQRADATAVDRRTRQTVRMTAEQSAGPDEHPDHGVGELQIALTTVVDEYGQGYDSAFGDRWDVEAYLPSEPSAKPALVVEATAYTIPTPDSLEAMVEAFEDLDVAGDYADAISRLDDVAGSFATLFDAATTLTDCDGILLIDQVRFDADRADADALNRVLVAIQNGPAGRSAAFVLADVSKWEVDVDDERLVELGLSRWAGTDVVGRINHSVSAERLQLAEALAAQITAVSDLEVTVRSGEVRLNDLIEQAQAAPAIRVRFELPPALPANVWAGAPADIEDVVADPETGAITIETADTTYEIVGAPGTAPQLVGAAADALPQTREWLRAVHERWWRYEDALHERVHEAVAEFTEGRLEEVPDEATPHLHMSEILRDLAPSPIDGDVHLVPHEGSAGTERGHVLEHEGPLVFRAVRDVDGEHEQVGFVRLYPDAHVEAWLLDDWMNWLPDHDQLIEHLLGRGADVFIANLLHEELYAGVVEAILIGDIRGH